MKKWILILLCVLNIPTASAVILLPGESFECGNTTFICQEQSCPDCIVTAENCTVFLNENISRIYSEIRAINFYLEKNISSGFMDECLKAKEKMENLTEQRNNLMDRLAILSECGANWNNCEQALNSTNKDLQICQASLSKQRKEKQQIENQFYTSLVFVFLIAVGICWWFWKRTPPLREGAEKVIEEGKL